MKKVVPVCVRWGRYVAKYKQIVIESDEGPVTKKIPIEWGFRCLEWKNIIVEEKDQRIGVREEYVPPPQPTGKLRPGSYKTVIRHTTPYQTKPSKRKKIIEFKGIRGCGRRR